MAGSTGPRAVQEPGQQGRPGLDAVRVVAEQPARRRLPEHEVQVDCRWTGQGETLGGSSGGCPDGRALDGAPSRHGHGPYGDTRHSGRGHAARGRLPGKRVRELGPEQAVQEGHGRSVTSAPSTLPGGGITTPSTNPTPGDERRPSPRSVGPARSEGRRRPGLRKAPSSRSVRTRPALGRPGPVGVDRQRDRVAKGS